MLATAPASEQRSSPQVQSFIELTIDQHAPIVQPAGLEARASAIAAALPPARRVRHAGRAGPSAKAELHLVGQSSVEQSVAGASTATAAAAADGAAKTLDVMPRPSLLAAGAWELFERHKKMRSHDAARTDVEHVLNTSLEAAANRPAYRERRAPPKLIAASDGGYEYSARAYGGTVLLFRAHIAQDGTVRFEDGANLQLAPIPISGTFELNDLLRRGEKHTAEKRWFLEQTAALRERLAAETLRTTQMRVGHLQR